MAIDPRQPTAFPAGSPEKVKVLAARARRELPLFVEGDSTGPAAYRTPQMQRFIDSYVTAGGKQRVYQRMLARVRERTRRKARERKAAKQRAAGR
jgi:hypothetical protein